jgi:truncated hemoglobin YjbI
MTDLDEAQAALDAAIDCTTAMARALDAAMVAKERAHEVWDRAYQAAHEFDAFTGPAS